MQRLVFEGAVDLALPGWFSIRLVRQYLPLTGEYRMAAKGRLLNLATGSHRPEADTQRCLRN